MSNTCAFLLKQNALIWDIISWETSISTISTRNLAHKMWELPSNFGDFTSRFLKSLDMSLWYQPGQMVPNSQLGPVATKEMGLILVEKTWQWTIKMMRMVVMITPPTFSVAPFTSYHPKGRVISLPTIDFFTGYAKLAGNMRLKWWWNDDHDWGHPLVMISMDESSSKFPPKVPRRHQQEFPESNSPPKKKKI